MKSLSVYIHIPFCVRKCKYCDFLSASAEDSQIQSYVNELCGEIHREAQKYKLYEVVTVFLGGGTPSLLSAKQTEQILSVLRSDYALSPGAEITMEVNPGTVTEQKASAWRGAGINRLSIGLQSAEDAELKILGRIHTWQDFLHSWKLVREAGFTNCNIDLMSGLPGQTLTSWCRTLSKVIALKPEHLSAYSLIIEEGTYFYELYGGGDDLQTGVCGGQTGDNGTQDRNNKQTSDTPPLPDEELDRQMYQETKAILAKAGYVRYEISNYARPGKECRHNKVYWTGENYVGFGLGAASMVEHVRFDNVRCMETYLNRADKTENRHELSREEQMEEYMFLGLRLMEGVTKSGFAQRFGRTMEEVYGSVIDHHCAEGLLAVDRDCVRLTDRGIDVSNYVMADFLL